jgi:hypothetical protein
MLPNAVHYQHFESSRRNRSPQPSHGRGRGAALFEGMAPANTVMEGDSKAEG